MKVTLNHSIAMSWRDPHDVMRGVKLSLSALPEGTVVAASSDARFAFPVYELEILPPDQPVYGVKWEVIEQ